MREDVDRCTSLAGRRFHRPTSEGFQEYCVSYSFDAENYKIVHANSPIQLMGYLYVELGTEKDRVHIWQMPKHNFCRAHPRLY